MTASIRIDPATGRKLFNTRAAKATETTEAPDPAPGAPVRGTIIEFSKSGSGVKITINKGGDAGVEEGWTGYVMNNATKRSLPKGSFKIKSVKSDESEGVTGLTLDQVQANRTVWLKPAK